MESNLSSPNEWLAAMILAGAGVGLAAGLGAGTALSIPFGVLVGVMHGFFMAPIAWRTIGRKPVVPAALLIALPTMGVAMLTTILLERQLAWGAALSMSIIMLLILHSAMPDVPAPTLIPCAKCGYEVQDVSLKQCPECGASLEPAFHPEETAREE